MTTASHTAEAPVPLAKGSIVALTLMGITAFLVGLDAAASTLALPSIQRDLSIDAAGLEWTTLSYMVASAAIAIPAGALADRLGKRRVYVAGIVLFAIGSVLCALSPQIYALILGRTIAGVGGATVAVLAMAMLASSVPRSQIPRIVGLWAAVSSSAAVIAPALTGLIVESIGWRWFFGMNVVPLLLAAVIVTRALPPLEGDHEGRVPILSLALLTGGVLAVTGALSLLGGTGSDTGTLIVLALGVALLVAFALQERRTPQQLIPWKAFARSPIPVCLLLLALISWSVTGSMYEQTMALQNAFDLSPALAGALDIAPAILFIVMAALAARISARVGIRWTVVTGIALIAAAVLGTALTDLDLSFVLLAIFTALLGAGMGLAGPTLNSTVLSNVSAADHGAASGALSLSSSFAAAIGIATMGFVEAASTTRSWLDSTASNLQQGAGLSDVVAGSIHVVNETFGNAAAAAAAHAYTTGVVTSIVVAGIAICIGIVIAIVGLRRVVKVAD